MTYDVVIIGGGVVGAATQYFLSKAGIHSVLLEKKAEVAKGASGSWGSLLRVFSVNQETTRKASESVPYYFRFAEETGFDCGLSKTGCLYFFSGAHLERISKQVDDLNNSRGTNLKIIRSHEGSSLFPAFQWLEGDFAIYEELAGYACPSKTTLGWLKASEKLGNTYHCNQGVKEFIKEKDKVTAVITEHGEEFKAKLFILTAGPWVKSLSDQLKLDLPIFPMCIQVNRFGGHNEKAQHPFFLDFDQISFGRQVDDSLYGGYCKEGIASTDNFKQPLNMADASEAKRRLSKRLSWLRTATLEGGINAIEAYTYDLKPYINFAPSLDNLLIGSGWSCSGFTLAPTYGKTLADLACEKLKDKQTWNIPVSPSSVPDQRPSL